MQISETLLYHDVGVCICTAMLLGAVGLWECYCITWPESPATGAPRKRSQGRGQTNRSMNSRVMGTVGCSGPAALHLEGC